jgi:hypothetical protein
MVRFQEATTTFKSTFVCVACDGDDHAFPGRGRGLVNASRREGAPLKQVHFVYILYTEIVFSD